MPHSRPSSPVKAFRIIKRPARVSALTQSRLATRNAQPVRMGSSRLFRCCIGAALEAAATNRPRWPNAHLRCRFVAMPGSCSVECSLLGQHRRRCVGTRSQAPPPILVGPETAMRVFACILDRTIAISAGARGRGKAAASAIATSYCPCGLAVSRRDLGPGPRLWRRAPNQTDRQGYAAT